VGQTGGVPVGEDASGRFRSGFSQPWLDQAQTKDELGVSPQYRAVFPLVVGYPVGSPPAVSRRDPEVVSWRWDAD